MILGPCVDVGRVPRAGRAGESLSGEDPVLGGRLGVEYVKGVQDQKVMACGKHFTVYNQETIRFLGGEGGAGGEGEFDFAFVFLVVLIDSCFCF